MKKVLLAVILSSLVVIHAEEIGSVDPTVIMNVPEIANEAKGIEDIYEKLKQEAMDQAKKITNEHNKNKVLPEKARKEGTEKLQAEARKIQDSLVKKEKDIKEKAAALQKNGDAAFRQTVQAVMTSKKLKLVVGNGGFFCSSGLTGLVTAHLNGDKSGSEKVAPAEVTLKISILNLEKITMADAELKKVLAETEQERKKAVEDAKKEALALDAEQKELEKSKNPDIKKVESFNKKREEFEKKLTKTSEDLKAKLEKAQKDLMDRIKKILNEVGIAHIVFTQNGDFFWSNPNIDISPDVKKGISEEFKKIKNNVSK